VPKTLVSRRNECFRYARKAADLQDELDLEDSGVAFVLTAVSAGRDFVSSVCGRGEVMTDDLWVEILSKTNLTFAFVNAARPDDNPVPSEHIPRISGWVVDILKDDAEKVAGISKAVDRFSVNIMEKMSPYRPDHLEDSPYNSAVNLWKSIDDYEEFLAESDGRPRDEVDREWMERMRGAEAASGAGPEEDAVYVKVLSESAIAAHAALNEELSKPLYGLLPQ
jgi:hypothetical protein